MIQTATSWLRRQLRYRDPRLAPIGAVFFLVGIAALTLAAITHESDRFFHGLLLILIGWVSIVRVRTAVVGDDLVLPYRWQGWRPHVICASEITAGVVAPPEGPNVMSAVHLHSGEIVDVSVDRQTFEQMMCDLGLPVREWQPS